jgi:hypothetical protein
MSKCMPFPPPSPLCALCPAPPTPASGWAALSPGPFPPGFRLLILIDVYYIHWLINTTGHLTKTAGLACYQIVPLPLVETKLRLTLCK